MDDAVDDAMDVGVEEEGDEVVEQVLEEIGVDFNQQASLLHSRADTWHANREAAARRDAHGNRKRGPTRSQDCAGSGRGRRWRPKRRRSCRRRSPSSPGQPEEIESRVIWLARCMHARQLALALEGRHVAVLRGTCGRCDETHSSGQAQRRGRPRARVAQGEGFRRSRLFMRFKIDVCNDSVLGVEAPKRNILDNMSPSAKNGKLLPYIVVLWPARIVLTCLCLDRRCLETL